MTEWICKEKQIIRQEDGTTIGVYLAREKELIRCKNCKYYILNNRDHMVCDYDKQIRYPEDFYCGNAERKNE